MNTELKHHEEKKRDRMWQKGERWRLVREATDWAEKHSGDKRNTKADRLGEQKKKLERLNLL